MHQTTLTNDPTTTSDEPTNTRTTNRESSSNAKTNLAPPDQRGGEDCCPWCLSAAETFEEHGDRRPRCGFCDAAIPVGADWFERGEKIVI